MKNAKPVWLLSILLLSGCAATGASFTPVALSDDTHALIYVYRLESDTGELLDVPILYVNGERLSTMRPKGYTHVEVPAGETELKIADSAMGVRIATLGDVTFDAEAGQTYYFWITRSERSGAVVNTTEILYGIGQEVSQERARYYLKQMRLQKPSIAVAPVYDGGNS